MDMRILWQDIRYGVRMLTRAPGFAVLVVGILAVGIAANTALFSVVNAVMLRPLPYKDSERLMTIEEDGFGRNKGPSYRPNFFYLQEHNTVFKSLAGSWHLSTYIKGIDQPQEVQAFMVTSNLFPVLGTQPALGRGFVREDENPGNQPIAILSDAFWKKHFGGDPNVIGTSMRLTTSRLKEDFSRTITDEDRIIVGVMPPGFTHPYARSAAFWIPMIRVKNPDDLCPDIRARAQLKKGVTPEQANAELAALLIQLDPDNAKLLAEGATVRVERVMDQLLEGHRKLPLMLLGAAGFVLLIACSNAANLFLARSTIRQREMAMRLALGASRHRVIRQMLTESLLLSLGAGILGLMLTFATVKMLVGLCPADIPRLQETRVDLTVLGFTLGISVLTGLLFGMIPAWRASDVSVGTTLKEGAGRTSTGRRWHRLHSSLVISQLGLSLVLLIGATLLIRSLISLTSVDLGFQPNNVLALHIELPETKYQQEGQYDTFYFPLMDRLRALPGVESVGALCCDGVGVDMTLGATELFEDPFYIEGKGDSESLPAARVMWVTPDFFTTMGIPFHRGQTLTDQGPDNVVIDEAFAHECFGDVDPIGKIIRFRRQDGEPVQVIGVVDTVRSFGTPEPGRGVVYGRARGFGNPFAVVLVRTTGDPTILAPSVRQQVAALEKDQVIKTMESLKTTLTRMLAPERFVMLLLSIFAGIAVALATIGLYGLLQYSTAQQTHDIGIRMALGAQQKDVRWMVLKRGLKLTLVGIVIGIAGAVALTRVLSSLLYDVTPTDPITLLCVSIALSGIALLACYLPARRAARIDPMEALHYE